MNGSLRSAHETHTIVIITAFDIEIYCIKVYLGGEMEDKLYTNPLLECTFKNVKFRGDDLNGF